MGNCYQGSRNKKSWSFGASVLKFCVLGKSRKHRNLSRLSSNKSLHRLPFVWDEEERRHLRARLDALYFHLYGLTREDAEYVLDTFPIVRREDEAAFDSYRTRDLILAYMNALSAGDTESEVALSSI